MKKIYLVIILEIKEWIKFFLRNIPGKIGIIIRRLIYVKNFNNVSIPTAFYFDSLKKVSFGKNISMGGYCHFYSNGGKIILKDNVKLNINVVLNSSIGGEIIIGQNSLIGPNVIIRTANHNFDRIDLPINQQGHNFGNVVIDKNVWIGANTIILGNVKIGEGAIIGAGSLVNKDIHSFTIVGGVPAKIIKKRI